MDFLAALLYCMNQPHSLSPGENRRDGKIDRRMAMNICAGGVILGLAGYFGKKLLHREHDHKAEVLEWWQREQHIFDAIDRSGGFQRYIDALPVERVHEAFMTPDENGKLHECRACGDEAIRRLLDEANRRMHLSKEAGSGILNLGVDGFEQGQAYDPFHPMYVTAVARQHNNENPTMDESWHEQCGAARSAYGIAHGLSKEQRDAVPDDIINEYARRFTLNVAQQRRDLLTRERRVREADSIRVRDVRFDNDMRPHRPSGLHIARVIYIDGTGKFDYGCEDLPLGYGVDRKKLDTFRSQNNMVRLKDINFSDHGPSELLTRDNPQRVVCIGDDELPHNRIVEECQTALANDPHYRAGRVTVTGFTPRMRN